MTSLRQKLIDYIRLHKQVHFRDIEKYAEDNGYKAYTATRRLQEVRNPKDTKHYDADVGALDENGQLITSGDATIKWYVYKPAFMPQQTQETPRREDKPPEPHTDYVPPIYEPKKKPQPFVARPPKASSCCEIAVLCWKKGFSVQHSRGCLNK